MSDVKCNICGASLPLALEDHYIARNNDKTGAFASLNSHEEPSIFDACDCPACGCQHIYQERKRHTEPVRIVFDEDDEQVDKILDAWIIQDMVNEYIEDGNHTYSEAAANFGIPRSAIACIMDQRFDRVREK